MGQPAASQVTIASAATPMVGNDGRIKDWRSFPRKYRGLIRGQLSWYGRQGPNARYHRSTPCARPGTGQAVFCQRSPDEPATRSSNPGIASTSSHPTASASNRFNSSQAVGTLTVRGFFAKWQQCLLRQPPLLSSSPDAVRLLLYSSPLRLADRSISAVRNLGPRCPIVPFFSFVPAHR